MSYDRNADLKMIQSDVLTVDTSDNEQISNLKKLKTGNKVVTKAINALNEQLGNANTSAEDAMTNMMQLKTEITELQQLLCPTTTTPKKPENVIGMVLVNEGGFSGTWARINENYETVDFDPSYGTWANIRQVTNDVYGEFTEIPITWVRTETLADGPYAGCNCWWISDHAEESFHVHPAFIGKDGQPHNLQIASYLTSKKDDNKPFSEDKGMDRTNYWAEINYDFVRSKRWMNDVVRPYSIYDHHFLARLMLIEFGTPYTQSLTINGVSWAGDERINYHGIYDPFGLPGALVKGTGSCYWIDGFGFSCNFFEIMLPDGSEEVVTTNVRYNGLNTKPVNCFVNKVDDIDFGDLFIANSSNILEECASFAAIQGTNTCDVCFTDWNPFSLYSYTPKPPSPREYIGWRLAHVG